MFNQSQPTNRQENIISKLIQIKSFFSLFQTKETKVGRPSKLDLSDIATINWLQARHQNITLKALYQDLLDNYSTFFNLPSYQNFVSCYNRSTVWIVALLQLFMNYSQSEHLIIDSTPIPVCHIKREKRHQTMKELASKCFHPLHNYFYGLKLHILTDLSGNLVNFRLTTATVFDGEVLPCFISRYRNKIYIADAAYLAQEYQQLAQKQDSFVLAKTRKNMKRIGTIAQNMFLNKRKRIEGAISSIKDKHNLVTSLPRSVNGYLAHYFRSLFQYTICDLDKVL